MVQALHCQLSSPSFLDEAALGELLSRSLPNFKYENIFLTSTDTAIVWLPDDAKAEDFIDIGKFCTISYENRAFDEPRLNGYLYFIHCIQDQSLLTSPSPLHSCPGQPYDRGTLN